MSVINTNIKSMVAQDAIVKNNRSLSTAMERLSTGNRINSAKDDAAGLSISTRMEAQTRGLSMAIRNANDGISLLQTAEGATDEVSSILQRMRELAVQSVNGTNNVADRAALNDEVQQLKQEIDRIADTTQFNNMNLLDGSFKNKILQIGDKAHQTLDVNLTSMKANALGISTNSIGGDMLVSSRIAPAAVDAGDITINGQELAAITALSDMEDIVNNINSNVDNVKASGFNVVVAKNVGNGVTTMGQLQIKVEALGSTALQAPTFNITASNSMDELVANINAEANGLVKASKDETGRLVLSNETGAAIFVSDQSGSATGAFDGGSGFVDSGTVNTFNVAGTFRGFLKLESEDGSPIRIERGNVGATSPGALSDLAVIGFREVTTEPMAENYTVTGDSLTSAGVTGTWRKTDLTINGVEIFDADIATNSFQGKLSAINNFTEKTGVSASAYFEKTFDMTDVIFPNDQAVTLNGKQIALGASLSNFATNINAQTGSTGLVATINGSNLTLSGANVQTVAVGRVDPNITTRLTSTVSAKGLSTALRTITVSSADVVAGRTIQVVARGDGGVTAESFAASYTIQLGDTKSSVALALRNAILNTGTQVNGQTGYSGGRSATSITVAHNILTLAAGSSGYGNRDIELRVTEPRATDYSITRSVVSDPSTTSLLARTVTIHTADVVAGRTIQLNFYQGANASPTKGTDFSVSYTIQTGDTAQKVASALVVAIENTSTGMYVGRGSGFSGTAAQVGNTAGVITIANSAQYGMAYGELAFINPALGLANTHFGAIRLDSVNNQPISIALGDGTTTINGEHGLLEQNVGAADYEVNTPTLGVLGGQTVGGLNVASQSSASKAISVIDNALDSVNKARSSMGALQNRLTNTVNNLDNIVTNTQASRSRIADTDYAKETTELARAQIIQQAATAMLAQANQMPQSVLALLQ